MTNLEYELHLYKGLTNSQKALREIGMAASKSPAKIVSLYKIMAIIDSVYEEESNDKSN